MFGLVSRFVLPGWLRAIGGFLRGIVDLVVKYPWQAALIVAVVFAGWQLRGRHQAERAAADAVVERDAARKALTDQQAEYRAAYRKAFVEHWNAKRKEDARLAAAKGQADDETDLARRDALDRAGRYAAGAVCMRAEGSAEADPGPARRPDLPGTAAAAEGSGKPAAAADLVAITRADFEACTLNSADLGTAWRWGQRVHAADNTSPKENEP